MTQRIFGVAEHEGCMTLVDPFRTAFVALADRVNLELAGVAEVALRLESFYRDPAEQAELWARGRTQGPGGRWSVTDRRAVVTHAPPGRSPHEYGEAAHLVLFDPVSKRWLPDAHPRWRWLGDHVEAAGLVWGGRFRHPDGSAFFDAAHVESVDWQRRARALGWRGLHR